MSQPWIFLCPSTRGISQALLNHLLLTTHPSIPILCTHRPNYQPPSLPPNPEGRKIHTLPLDVTLPSTISHAAKQTSVLFPPETHHLHLSFTLPGILLNPERSTAQIDHSTAVQTFQVNTLGPLLLIKHFARFLPSSSSCLNNKTQDQQGLPKHPIWTFASARVGSTSDNNLGGWYSYRASKAALNSIIKTFDIELSRSKDAMAVGYHPGTVKTDLSKDFWFVSKDKERENMFSPEDAAKKLVDVVFNLKLEQRGKVWDWKGEEVFP
ncbi:hypothetical protein QBC44DRAFT_323622 [Cladorrhinum sp. PSN332]|nr:hypothetical protein QBC44DRAFT_323622 [Cladorrhinum sp. PSN332]